MTSCKTCAQHLDRFASRLSSLEEKLVDLVHERDEFFRKTVRLAEALGRLDDWQANHMSENGVFVISEDDFNVMRAMIHCGLEDA